MLKTQFQETRTFICTVPGFADVLYVENESVYQDLYDSFIEDQNYAVFINFKNAKYYSSFKEVVKADVEVEVKKEAKVVHYEKG